MFKLRIINDVGFEFWDDIPGYEGLYQASTYGRIKSIPRNGTKGCIIKQVITSNGYYRTKLSKNNVTKNHFVHRLIAITFIPNYNNKETINHKDENKLSNLVSNLEWLSLKENINYGTHNKRTALGESLPVIQLDYNGNIIKKYTSITDVYNLNGYHISNICSCCRGKIKTAYGYIWKYA